MGAVDLHQWMGKTAHVPELQEDLPALGMDRVGHLFPAGDLLRSKDPWRSQVTLALGRHLGAFADDQAGAGPLAVVLGHQGRGCIASARAAAGHRCHYHAVVQGQLADLSAGQQKIETDVSHDSPLRDRVGIRG